MTCAGWGREGAAQLRPCGEGRLGNPEEPNPVRCLVLEGVCSSHCCCWGGQVSSAVLSRGFDYRGDAGHDWEKSSFSVLRLWVTLR